MWLIFELFIVLKKFLKIPSSPIFFFNSFSSDAILFIISSYVGLVLFVTEGRFGFDLSVTFDFPRISLLKSWILSSKGKDLNFCKDLVDYRTI